MWVKGGEDGEGVSDFVPHWASLATPHLCESMRQSSVCVQHRHVLFSCVFWGNIRPTESVYHQMCFGSQPVSSISSSSLQVMAALLHHPGEATVTRSRRPDFMRIACFMVMDIIFKHSSSLAGIHQQTTFPCPNNYTTLGAVSGKIMCSVWEPLLWVMWGIWIFHKTASVNHSWLNFCNTVKTALKLLII